jgi:ZIP family zinc transporter
MDIYPDMGRFFMEQVTIALGLTFLAGMATGIGSIIAFFAKRTDYRFLSISTGFSAGVMLYVSFIEIFPEGAAAFGEAYGPHWGNWLNAVSFFGGILVMGLIDNIVPEAENPHTVRSGKSIIPLHEGNGIEVTGQEEYVCDGHHPLAESDELKQAKLLRMGLFTALAIGIHNFPEGLATFLASLQDTGVGVAIAFAIALHNIPEGISVSVPIFYATGNRRKAFFYSVLSGIAEPVGALIAYFLLLFLSGDTGTVVSPGIMGAMFGGIAGIMVYISLDELIPASHAYGKGHDSMFGLVGGMMVMAISLLLMK